MSGARRIEAVPTSITAFVGQAANGPADEPTRVRSFEEFARIFGDATQDGTLSQAVGQYFQNGGVDAIVVRTSQPMDGLDALDGADLFNLLCIPPAAGDGQLHTEVLATASACCARRRALLIVGPPTAWKAAGDVTADALAAYTAGVERPNAAIYFPRVTAAGPSPSGVLTTLPPCGAVAGVTARTDAGRGVWTAPAGKHAELNGVDGLALTVTDAENGRLNPLGVNCLRSFPGAGAVVWGARTLDGDDARASDWKYVPVRRTALFIEESVDRGTQWAVFEPNDEPLWAQIRLSAGAFLHDLFQQGAFKGTTPDDAYFASCDETTMTQDEIDGGIVNIEVGFAALKPAEFVTVRIQQRPERRWT